MNSSVFCIYKQKQAEPSFLIEKWIEKSATQTVREKHHWLSTNKQVFVKDGGSKKKKKKKHSRKELTTDFLLYVSHGIVTSPQRLPEGL